MELDQLKLFTDLVREHEEAPYQSTEDFWPPEEAEAR